MVNSLISGFVYVLRNITRIKIFFLIFIKNMGIEFQFPPSIVLYRLQSKYRGSIKILQKEYRVESEIIQQVAMA